MLDVKFYSEFGFEIAKVTKKLEFRDFKNSNSGFTTVIIVYFEFAKVTKKLEFRDFGLISY